MATPKEVGRELLDKLPDSATYEDIQYQIYVRAKIERGLKEIEEGRFVTHEEMERLFAEWLREG